MEKLKSLSQFNAALSIDLRSIIGGKEGDATSSSVHTVNKQCSDTKVYSDHEGKGGVEILDSVCTYYECN
ncbi:MAG: hypothetical protein ACK50A_11225 [Sphingobacteriaceae bacterium]